MSKSYNLIKNAGRQINQANKTANITGIESLKLQTSDLSVREVKLIDNFLVDRRKLAEILSLAPSTISKMMADEGLPHYKIGKACRFKVSEVMAFLNNRRRP